MEMNLLWKRYSILKTEDNKYVIVLIFDKQEDSYNMHSLITLNQIKVTLTSNEKGEMSLWLEFENSDVAIKDTLSRTIENYPPLQWAANGLVQYITTGYLAPPEFQYRKDFKEISTFSFN